MVANQSKTSAIQYTGRMYQYINICHQEKIFSWHTALSTKLLALLFIFFIGIYSIKDIHAEESKTTIWINPDTQIDTENDLLNKNGENYKTRLSDNNYKLSWEILDQLSKTEIAKNYNEIFLATNTLVLKSQLATSEEMIQQLRKTRPSQKRKGLLELLYIKILYLSEKYRSALDALAQMELETLSKHNKKVVSWLRIGSLLGTNDLPGALRNMQSVDDTGIDPITASMHQLIWDTLRSMSRDEIKKIMQDMIEPTSKSWLSLAVIFTNNTQTHSVFISKLEEWQAHNLHHAANKYVMPYTRSKGSSEFSGTRKIAMLLPLSSTYGKASEAIKDGFMLLANNPNASETSIIRVYDFGEKTELIGTYFDAAVRDQANLIIGPIGSSAINQLAKRAVFPVPTLLFGSLNERNKMHHNSYQFSLAPEYEAMSLAARGLADGHRRVITFYPNTKQGQQIFKQWNRSWEKLGGTIAQSQTYDPSISDQTQLLKKVFHIDFSETRAKALQRTLGSSIQLKFTPRRREDIDAIFILSNVEETRLIKPQIDFHHAHNVMVYSLNSNYSGISDRVKDLDIEGIVFGEMPWIINHGTSIKSIRELIPKIKSNKGLVLDRLFALGIDTYGLLNHLDVLQENEDMSYHGVTGNLFINKQGQVIRQQKWFKMENALPRHLRLTSLPTPPKLDLKAVPYY